MNCICGDRLNEAVVKIDDAELRYKSCPNCSVQAGRHAYHAEQDFGLRHMGDGRHIAQSWCPECRSLLPPQAVAAHCS